MKPNNHTAPSDADMLHEVDQLVNQGRASGDPILDSLRTHIPRAEAAQAQALEDELVALWEGGEQVKENVGQYPVTPLIERARLAQPSRAGRLPYMATLAAMIAVVMAVVLLNRPPSSAPTGSQSQVTPNTRIITATTNPVMINPVIIVTATPSNGLVDVITATASVPPAEATAIQAELNAVTATHAANAANADAQPIEPVYATATYIVAQATAIQAENLVATQASQPTQVSQPTVIVTNPENGEIGDCYLVQADDTIESIARENGITAEQILQSNAEIAQAFETDEGIIYRLWLSPSSCLRLSPPTPVAGGIVSIIAPYSLLIPRDADQPPRLEVGDRISLYVGVMEFSPSGEPLPFDSDDFTLLVSGVQVMAILDHADEYVISIPQEIRPIIAWLWPDTNAKPLVYEVE